MQKNRRNFWEKQNEVKQNLRKAKKRILKEMESKAKRAREAAKTNFVPR